MQQHNRVLHVADWHMRMLWGVISSPNCLSGEVGACAVAVLLVAMLAAC
jgi:hypothetical protein